MNGRGNFTSRKRYCIQARAKKMGHRNVADRAICMKNDLPKASLASLLAASIGRPCLPPSGPPWTDPGICRLVGDLLDVPPDDQGGQGDIELPDEHGQQGQRQGAQEKIHPGVTRDPVKPDQVRVQE